ncbi:MAG TPA: serine hydrolase domain-containing protein, partial [Actinomycetota bacterium]|nr:serine hydrolase domain-containing protein [Actinomycetota bacterium]
FHEGRKVVDLSAAAAGSDWTADSLPLWMSVTKAMTALCLQILWDRGKVDVDAPIATYWPEFAAAGKDAVTVADVMTHRSGVLGSADITNIVSLEDGSGLERLTEIVDLLAAAKPVWEPGTQTGYHTISYGWILGEVIRRIDGRRLDEFFSEEVARPLGVEASIGVPHELHHRIPTILPNIWPDAMPDVLKEYMENVLALARDPSTPAGISCLARDGVGALDRIPELFNSGPGRATPMGASNLAGSASSVARIFAAIAEPDVLVSTRSVEYFTSVRNEEPDVVLLFPISRALGYWRNRSLGRPQAMGPNEETFGHTGAGGQIGFCDPKAKVGAAFVRSHYTVFPLIYFLLNDAVYRVIGNA